MLLQEAPRKGKSACFGFTPGVVLQLSLKVRQSTAAFLPTPSAQRNSVLTVS